ncbi:SusE domain-containing protein [Ferruginibacter sp. SUN002]|uniref:SusE domain-containing protein n=1 Tax=Ferruginibacter sp. SUN002 TaxID=2937789 RepID=UPI003D362D86
MKKIFNRFFVVSCTLVLLASCKKEGAKDLVDGSFPDNALSSSTNTIVLSQASESAVAATFNWLASSYGPYALVGTYTLQIDIGTDGWATPLEFTLTRDSLEKKVIGKVLNDFLTAKGFTAGTPSTFLARVKSDISQYNGSASSIETVYSNTLTITATTYATTLPPSNGYLYVVGGYQSWDPSSAPKINEAKPKKFEGFINFPASSSDFYFKYTSAPDWDHTNYGNSSTNGIFTIYVNPITPDPPAMAVPSAGYYYLTANIDPAVKAWTATKTTWSIIGDATAGGNASGWNTDIPMTYDAGTKKWTVTANMSATGSFKFRANNAWVLDFGIAAGAPAGKLSWSDNPLLGYDASINNLTVAEDGNYTITLDLSNSGNYTYTAIKN